MRFALILIAALAAAAPALAGQPVTLRAETFDADGVVTLGDLFDGAGAAAGVAVARRTGASVMLDALAVQAAARRSGLDWANPEGLRRIVVQGGPAQAGVVPAGAAAARGNVDVLTWARSLAAGEVVQPQDLVWSKAAGAPADAARDADTLVGQAARRPLRAGAVATARDIAAVQVVKAGDVVTLVFEDEGVSLALQAKAVTSGGVGETITALNTASKKTIQAVVSGPGQARVGPTAGPMAAAPSRVALR